MFEDVDVKRVFLPMQQWQAVADTYSGDTIAEARKGDAPGVRTTEFEGFLYTVTSTMTGGHDAIQECTAWQLVPEKMYVGNPFSSNDWESQYASGRKRGDYVGFLVKVRGARMVCFKKVVFRASLPETQPVSLAQAKKFNEELDGYGWRFRFDKDTELAWGYLQGHPVVAYESDDDQIQVLFWRNGRKIEEYRLPADTVLDVCAPVFNTETRRPVAVQASLF